MNTRTGGFNGFFKMKDVSSYDDFVASEHLLNGLKVVNKKRTALLNVTKPAGSLGIPRGGKFAAICLPKIEFDDAS